MQYAALLTLIDRDVHGTGEFAFTRHRHETAFSLITLEEAGHRVRHKPLDTINFLFSELTHIHAAKAEDALLSDAGRRHFDQLACHGRLLNKHSCLLEILLDLFADLPDLHFQLVQSVTLFWDAVGRVRLLLLGQALQISLRNPHHVQLLVLRKVLHLLREPGEILSASHAGRRRVRRARSRLHDGRQLTRRKMHLNILAGNERVQRVDVEAALARTLQQLQGSHLLRVLLIQKLADLLIGHITHLDEKFLRNRDRVPQ